MQIATRVAGLAARASGSLSRRLGRGGGTTVPGVVLLKLRPNAIAELIADLPMGAVFISATNGKTTTTRLVVAAAKASGLQVVTNEEGSNLERGVAAALLEGPEDGEIGIFEVDEAALVAITRTVTPRTLLLMNLFRDQLDRYGELDTLVNDWRDMLDRLERSAEPPHLVLNADDPNIADLGREREQVTWFGVADVSHALPQRAHAADATNCRRCGTALVHEPALLGHLGHWRCDNCDAARPTPDVAATAAVLHPDRQHVTIRSGDTAATVTSELTGLHNTYNLTAAMATTLTLDGDADTAAAALGATQPAFGRGERIEVDGRRLNLLLAKNPTGVNQNIRTLLAGGSDSVHVLALLNDRTADGRDVSWIWDVDWEPLDGQLASLTISGDRAWDLALRFRYAGFDMTTITVEPDTARALDIAIESTPAASTLHALATYTAMLDLRAELTRRGHVDAYWSES